MDAIGDYLWDVASAVGSQLVLFLGGLAVLGVALHYLERWTSRVLEIAFGWDAVLFTGWIGTSLHEIGHAVFCPVFGHRITDMELFKPNPDDPVLGYVNHAYNRESLYQEAGNFFIGLGPIFAGTVGMVACVYWILPGGGDFISSVTSKETVENAGFVDQLRFGRSVVNDWFAFVVSRDVLLSWRSVVFLYVSTCISAHIAPSPKDMEGVAAGFGTLLFLAVLVNAIALIWVDDPTAYAARAGGYVSLGVALLMLAAVLSAINFVVSYLVSAAIWRRRYNVWLSPF